MDFERITLADFVKALESELAENGQKQISSIGVCTSGDQTSYLVCLNENTKNGVDIKVPIYMEDYKKKYNLK